MSGIEIAFMIGLVFATLLGVGMVTKYYRGHSITRNGAVLPYEVRQRHHELKNKTMVVRHRLNQLKNDPDPLGALVSAIRGEANGNGSKPSRD